MRTSPSPWRDPRLWWGVLLVTASVLVGAKVLAAADETVGVWAVSADVPAGTPVGELPVVVRRVHLADADPATAYLPADQPLPDAGALTRALGAGELLPRSALGESSASGLVQLPVPVDGVDVPGEVVAGRRVDVFVTSTSARGGASEPALADALVVAADRSTDGLGDTGQVRLVLGVPADDVADWFEAIDGVGDPRVVVVLRP